MKNRDILVVAEGPDDAKVIRRILKAYDIYAEHNIYEYKTNVYCLYDVLQEETDGDWEQVDIPLLLRSRESNTEKREMLSRKFTEIILIFDFDPQHTTYDYAKIKRLFSFFCNSETFGKLYIDYPMIESFYHINAFPNDMGYKTRAVTKEILVNHKYKELVHWDSSPVRGIIDYNKKGVIDNIIQINLMKTKYILFGDFTRVNTYPEYYSLEFANVLDAQAKLYEREEYFFVLCTCVFYVLDFDYRKFFAN